MNQIVRVFQPFNLRNVCVHRVHVLVEVSVFFIIFFTIIFLFFNDLINALINLQTKWKQNSKKLALCRGNALLHNPLRINEMNVDQTKVSNSFEWRRNSQQ